MNTSFTARAFAAVAAAATTFVLFGAVASLAQPQQGTDGVLLAQATPATAQR